MLLIRKFVRRMKGSKRPNFQKAGNLGAYLFKFLKLSPFQENSSLRQSFGLKDETFKTISNSVKAAREIARNSTHQDKNLEAVYQYKKPAASNLESLSSASSTSSKQATNRNQRKLKMAANFGNFPNS